MPNTTKTTRPEPAVDRGSAPAAPVIRAQWVGDRINYMTGALECQCSNCRAWSAEWDRQYCSTCGALMDTP